MTDTREWATPAELVATSLMHRWRADVSGLDKDGLSIGVTFDSSDASSETGHRATLISARVDQDVSRVPAVSATVTVADAPESLIERLDARRDLVMTLEAGYAFTDEDGWGDLHPIAQVKLDRITRDETGRVTLTGYSVEQVILDNSELDPPWATTGLPAAQVIDTLARQAGGYIDISSVPAGPTTVTRSQDAWDGIQEVCNAQSWRVRASTYGLELVPLAVGTEASRADLATGKDGTLIRRAVEQSRTNYANRVRVIYEWRDAANASQRIVGTWSSATYDTAGNRRTATIKRSTSTTQARANAAAAAIGARMLRRGRVYRVAALAHYWLRPDDVVTITDPDTHQPERGLIESLTFNSDGTMDLTTRSTS